MVSSGRLSARSSGRSSGRSSPKSSRKAFQGLKTPLLNRSGRDKRRFRAEGKKFAGDSVPGDLQASGRISAGLSARSTSGEVRHHAPSADEDIEALRRDLRQLGEALVIVDRRGDHASPPVSPPPATAFRTSLMTPPTMPGTPWHTAMTPAGPALRMKSATMSSTDCSLSPSRPRRRRRPRRSGARSGAPPWRPLSLRRAAAAVRRLPRKRLCQRAHGYLARLRLRLVGVVRGGRAPHHHGGRGDVRDRPLVLVERVQPVLARLALDSLGEVLRRDADVHGERQALGAVDDLRRAALAPAVQPAHAPQERGRGRSIGRPSATTRAVATATPPRLDTYSGRKKRPTRRASADWTYSSTILSASARGSQAQAPLGEQ